MKGAVDQIMVKLSNRDSSQTLEKFDLLDQGWI